jgi:serine protease Do
MRFPSFSTVGLLLTLGTLSTGTLGAQSTVRTPARVRGPIMATSAANLCAELAATPSALVNAPEGMALLRLKRELESAAFTLEQQQQLHGVDVQRITQVQRGVDSLMRVVVRYKRADGSDGPVVTINRGDSVRVIVEGRAIEPPPFFASVDSTMRAVAPQMEATIRSLQPEISALIATAEAQSRRDAAEAGYMGVGLLGAQVRLVTPDGVLVSHCDYPVVETVDVGSPASRAGVLAGDTVLAYNGRDLKQRAVDYQHMLVPGETVRLRVKRGSKSREIPVTITARSVEREFIFMRGPDAPTSSLPPDAPRALGGRVVISSSAPPARPASPVAGTFSTSGVAVLLGAQFTTVDDEFAESLGLEPGILVLRVPPGTPVGEAGIRGGEVIRAINGVAVRDVQALRRVLVGGGTREARLTVISRASGPRTVTLRW